MRNTQQSPSSIDQQQAWNFALSLYEQHELAKTCLFLQDNYDFNVNLLLLYTFCDLHQISLTTADIVTINNVCKDSVEEIKLHRKKRQQAKSRDQILYANLLQQEVQLELTQHRVIVRELNSILRCKVRLHLAGKKTLKRYLATGLENETQISFFSDLFLNALTDVN